MIDARRRRDADAPALPRSARPRWPPAAPRSGSGSTASRSSGKPLPLVALGAQPAGLPARQHAWDGDAGARRATATRSRRGSTGCCSSTSRHADARRTRGCSRRRCGRSSARYPWGPRVCCSPPAGGRATSSARSASPRRSRAAKGLSDFELPAIDDYDLCLHLACDDEQRLAAVEAALVHGAPLPGPTARSTLARAALARDAHRLRRHRAAGRAPGRRRHPARRPGAAGLRRCSWASSRACARTRRPRTTSRSPTGRSPAARRCRSATCACGSTAGTQGLSRARAGRAHVRPAGHARAGQRASPTDAESDPQPARSGDQPLRRHRPLPDLGARPPQRQAADHPPRLQHRRRRPGRAALRLACSASIEDFVTTRNAMNAANASSRTRRSPTPSTTASTSSSSSSSAPTTSSRRAPTARSRCCGRDYLGARSRLDRAPERVFL